MTPYYQDDKHGITLYCGDCREVLPGLDDVGCTITDPPYSAATMAGARTRNDAEFSGDSLVPFSITEEQIREAFDLVAARTKRWIVASVDWRHGTLLEQQPPSGFRFVRAGCWVKTNSAPQFSGDRPAHGWEFVACLHNSAEKLRWNGGGKRGVWTTNIENQNGHPTPKPLALIKEWITDFADHGDVILDPFAGSGTTLVAAKQLGHHAIGIEIEEKYAEIAANRLRQGVFQFSEQGG